MSQIEEVNEQVIEKILTTDEFWEALWGKEEFTPNGTITVPNDYNCGAICNSLEYVYEMVREITESDITELSEPYIDIVIYFFSGLKRFTGENTEDLTNRMKSLLVRECTWRSDRFGTPWDILNILCYYVDRSFLFYVPNAVITDLMINGSFEDAIVGEWVFNPSGDRTIDDSFDGSWKLDFSGFTDVYQTIAVTAGTYILNSFVNPVVAPSGVTDIFNLIIQRDSDSFYFNTSSLAWVASDPSNVFSTSVDGYQLTEFFMIADGSYNVEIKFLKIVDFYLDHVEFGEKVYPAFEIIYVDSGFGTDFSSVWETGETEFENASYLDQDYMFGSATSAYSDTYFQALIDLAKASGVKGIFNRELRG